MSNIDLTVDPNLVDDLIKKVMENINVRLSDPTFPNDVRFNYDEGEGEEAVLMRATLKFDGVQRLVDGLQLQFSWSTGEKK